MSEQVKLLEEETGFRLFRADIARHRDLTDRGRTFLYEAERVSAIVLSLSDTARRLRGAQLDTFKIGMGSGMAQIFMPRLFADLDDDHARRAAGDLHRADAATSSTNCTKRRIDAGIAHRIRSRSSAGRIWYSTG